MVEADTSRQQDAVAYVGDEHKDDIAFGEGWVMAIGDDTKVDVKCGPRSEELMAG